MHVMASVSVRGQETSLGLTWPVAGWGPCGIVGCSRTAPVLSRSCPGLPLERDTAGLQSWCSSQCLWVCRRVYCCAGPLCCAPLEIWPVWKACPQWRPACGRWGWQTCCERQRSWAAGCCWWMSRRRRWRWSAWWCWPRTAQSRTAATAGRPCRAYCATVEGGGKAGSSPIYRCWLAGRPPAPASQTA